MGHALKDGRGDLAPTTYLLFKEIVYLIVGFTILQTRLFSFKNYQLMSVTHSLFRPSGRAVVKPDRN